MLAIAHNGNLVNSDAIRRQLEERGGFAPIFHTTTDTETILYLVARHPDPVQGIQEAARAIRGAYSLILLTPTELVAVRDPQGFRPLVLGRLGDACAVASETCAFDLSGIEFLRDVEPGELIRIDDRGLRSARFAGSPRRALCIFEVVYLARAASRIGAGTASRRR
jgi:amidophosphoribosyltransferase